MRLLTLTAPLFLIAATVGAQQPAHVDTSRHFLWFTGHWNPAKRNVFIIDPGPKTVPGSSTGNPGNPANPANPGDPGDPGNPGETPVTNPPGSSGTITVEPDGSIRLRTSGTDAWNKWVDKAQQSEDKYIHDLRDPQDNLDPATHHLDQLLLPDAEERQQQFAAYKIDPQQDLLTGQKPAAPGNSAHPSDRERPSASGARPTSAIGDYCKSAKSDYDAVISYYTNHVKGHGNDLNVPPPPAFEYNCYACDSNLRKSDDTTVEHYVRDFVHPEDSILAKGFRILHNLGAAGIQYDAGMDGDTYEALFAINKKDPSHSGACSFLSPGDLYHALYETCYHLEQRAEKLVWTNRKNFRAAKAIIRTYLAVARGWALLSGNVSAFESREPDLEGLISQNIAFYHDAFRKNDWRTIGNIPYLLNLYRDFELLGGSDADFQQYLTQLLKIINGFKLTIEMDIKIGKDNGYRLTHVKGDCHIIPFFQKDSNQCYKWVVADDHQQDIMGFYKPKMLPSIDCQLIANEMTTPPNAPKIVYTGTRKYTTLLQSLSMDFCNPGHDTIALTGFSPNPASNGVWQFPYAPNQNLGVNGMEQFFEDMMAKKKLVDNGDAQKEADNMQQQGEQLKKEMEALKGQMGGSQGGVSYEKIQELMNKARALTTTAVAAKILYLDFLLPVQNNNTVLVDKKYNAKEINPAESEAIVYGYYTIHIENDGNGKPKPAPKK